MLKITLDQPYPMVEVTTAESAKVEPEVILLTREKPNTQTGIRDQ